MLLMTSPTSTQTINDPRTVMFAAADQVAALSGLVTPADLDRPTPCAEYDVRLLLCHLLGVLSRMAHVASGSHWSEVPSMVTDVADDALHSELVRRAQTVRTAWTDDDVLDRTLTLPFGTLPGRGGAVAYVSELTTHAWDLASAIGRTDLLDDALGEAGYAAASQFIPDAARGQIPFGAVVEVPAEASPYARLAGWLGRDPGFAAAG
jgi:uncharacterized protein (TIGR03086 family)